MMLALSVRQPWAELIVAGRKAIEVRTFWPRLQLPVLVAIHAGKQLATDVPLPLWKQAGFDPDIGWVSATERDHLLRLGGIIGVARLVERIDFGGRCWPIASGQREWHELAAEHLNPLTWWRSNFVGFRFDQPVRFEQIIPCRGRQGFFELEPEIEARVKEAMGG